MHRSRRGQSWNCYLEPRARQFEDFSSLLESTCIDAGEDGLGEGGVHITNLNIAHSIHDEGEKVLKQGVEHLEADIPGDADIGKIEAEIAKMDAKLGVNKEEGTANGTN